MTDTLLVRATGLTVWDLGRPHPSASLVNVGTTALYLDDAGPLVPPTNGTALNPGANTVWDADRALYVGVAAGTTGSLQVGANAAGIFDPSQISTQLIAQGLPTQIAAAINLVGVPAIDRTTVLYQSTFAVAAGVTINTIPDIDVSSYPSLMIVISDDTSAIPYNGINTRRWYASWLDTTATYTTDIHSYVLSNATGGMRGQIRTHGPVLRLEADPVARNATVTITIIGSYREIPNDTLYFTNNVTFASSIPGDVLDYRDGYVCFSAIIAAIGTYSYSPDMFMGTYILFAGASQPSTLSIQELGTFEELYRGAITATPSYVPTLYFGRINIKLIFTTTVINTAFNICLARATDSN